jgi:hypothetical protein
MAYISIENWLANILTKALPFDHFECLCNMIGMSVVINALASGSFGVNESTSTLIIHIIPPCK